MTRNVPTVLPAVNKPLALMVPPVDEKVTGEDRKFWSDHTAVAVNCRDSPRCTVTPVRGATVTAVTNGDAAASTTIAQLCEPPSPLTVMTAPPFACAVTCPSELTVAMFGWLDTQLGLPRRTAPGATSRTDCPTFRTIGPLKLAEAAPLSAFPTGTIVVGLATRSCAQATKESPTNVVNARRMMYTRFPPEERYAPIGCRHPHLAEASADARVAEPCRLALERQSRSGTGAEDAQAPHQYRTDARETLAQHDGHRRSGLLDGDT
jgi:hypothetical protein